MEPIHYLVVVDENEERGVVDARQIEGASQERVTIRLSDGQAVVLPQELLVRQPDGTYRVAFSFRQARNAETHLTSLDAFGASAAGNLNDVRVIPVIAEDVVIGKHEVEAGRVRITKTVREEERIIDEPVLREEVDVERRPVNQYIDAPVEVRYEGDTMIVPLFEEVLVVEKRLLLREELYITKRKVEERHPQTITLRREEVSVERIVSNEKGSQS